MTIDDRARCRRCGYPLRGLTTPVCPECGRPFDPADPRTMDLGRQPGVVGRFLLRRTGWLPVLLLLAGAAAVAFATRWPRGHIEQMPLDWLYYFPTLRGLRGRLLSPTDWAYVAGLTAAAVAALWCAGRFLLRLLAGRVYRRRPDPPVSVGRRAVVLGLGAVAATVAAGGVLIGWPYRIARLWVRRLLAVYKPGGQWFEVPRSPVNLPSSGEVAVLRAGVFSLPTARERLAAIKLLLEIHPDQGLPIVRDALRREEDATLRATLLHIVGLYRAPGVVSEVLEHWEDPDASVRAAAADAVGLIHAPAYSIPVPSGGTAALDVDPQVCLDELLYTLSPTRVPPGYSHFGALLPNEPRPVSPDVRAKLIGRLTTGTTALERTAAAGALLRWQDEYHFRFAEWGVFVDDGTGRLSLSKSLVDEVPPFVHRTGDTPNDLAPRIYEYGVDKPVVHMTVDRPMVVDVAVVITDGRPWFAYPLPDDYTLATQTLGDGLFLEDGDAVPDLTVRLRPFDRPGDPKLDDPRDGYRWLTPKHRLFSVVGNAANRAAAIIGVGVRWQSVIVSPDRLPWMSLQPVATDPKFAWWERLRQVPCSWVSSRGEADRFLYYDGPTTRPPPVVVKQLSGGLTFQVTPSERAPEPRDFERSFKPIPTAGRSGPRRGLAVFVSVDNWAVGYAMDLPEQSGDWHPSAPPLVGEAAVAAALHRLLTDAGLNGGEADGLVDCWRPQFFRTPGERFVMVMRTGDYDALCPIRVDPPPTEMVRVGLVLTEFG